MLITFCPQTYHLLWIKFFSILAQLPTLSKNPITGVGVKSNIARGSNKVNEMMFFHFLIECVILSIQLLSIELVIVCLVYFSQMEMQGCSQGDRRN